MAAHVRDRRADLERALTLLRADALAAFDDGREMVASVTVHLRRDGSAVGNVVTGYPEALASAEATQTHQ